MKVSPKKTCIEEKSIILQLLSQNSGNAQVNSQQEQFSHSFFLNVDASVINNTSVNLLKIILVN